MYFIGVDIGTGSTKAIALDTTGKVLFATSVAYPTIRPSAGYAEQAPELIWQAFVKCINRIVEQTKENPQGICLSSAMHSLIAVDANGTPLMNMIIWADNRSADIATRIKESSIGKALYEQTGTPIHAMSPLTKILWLHEHATATFEKASKFISIKEYIWHKLFNVYEVDHSLASAMGLFNIIALTWDKEALQTCNITEDKLSTPVSTGTIRKGIDPQVATQINIDPNTSFIIGASDGCLANLGSFAIEHGTAALTIGTSGAIRVASSSPIYNFSCMPFNYRLDENTFISGGPINNGGVALKWYAEQFLKLELKDGDDYNSLLSNINDITPGSNGLIFLPYILGERAPIWNSDSCGVFFGFTAQHTQAHFTRAVIEGICLSLYQIADSLKHGISIEEIHVSGGFVHSHDWVQVLADVFGKPICLNQTEDASAIGACYMGMKALHIISDYKDLQQQSSKRFLPNMDHHALYKENVFPRYDQLYKVLKLEMAIFHEQKTSSLTPSAI